MPQARTLEIPYWSLLTLLFLSGSLAHAQTPPPCASGDLEITLHVYQEPDSVERITPVTRNISAHDCRLMNNEAPDFGSPEIKICLDCANRLPGGESLGEMPLILQPGATAHQSLRYRTSNGGPLNSGQSNPGEVQTCVPVRWITILMRNGGIHDRGQAVFKLTSKSLLKPVCSAVDVVGYLPGPGDGAASNDAPPARERQLALHASRSTYYSDESFYLRTEPEPAVSAAPPVLLISERSAEGESIREVRFGEMYLGPGISSHKGDHLDGKILDISVGACCGSRVLGTHSFQVLQLDGITPRGELHFLRSQPLILRIADPSLIARTWGVTTQGARADLTLDKAQFQLGEDIAVHIATQIVQGQKLALGSLHLSITDADGPIEQSDFPNNLDQSPIVTSMLYCPKPLEVGEVWTLDPSLRDYGMLPRRPGTYHLSIIWKPRRWQSSPCGLLTTAPIHEPSVAETVTSNPVTVTVVGDPLPTLLPKFPEYTAWRAHFRLVDTTFGPKTALLDLATGLQWLRPAISVGPGGNVEEILAARKAQDPDLSPWRFATRDEVRTFLVHFTGSPDGSSKNPSIERKLLRLLGGTLEDEPSPQSGWIGSSIHVRIAGSTPTPANSTHPGFVWYGVAVGEMTKDKTMRVWISDGPGWSRDKEFFGGDGFFLVRK